MAEHPAKRFLDEVLDQRGDRVRYGTEVAHGAADSDTWDSSELVEWAARRAGVDMPDGSWKQYSTFAEGGHATTTENALRTPGALLFKFSSDPLEGIPAQRQVMISLGNGQVIDASGARVRVVDADAAQFTHAALIPELVGPDDGDVGLGVHIEARLMEGGEDASSAPPAPVPPSTPPTPTPRAEETKAPPTASPDDDPIALRKEVVDTRQRADELRKTITDGEAFRGTLASDAQQRRTQAQANTDEAARLAAEGREAFLAADALEGDARTAKIEEAERIWAREAALKQDAERLTAEASALDHRIKRADESLTNLRTEAEQADTKAAELFQRSNAAIEARAPETSLDGPSMLEDVVIANVPAPLAPGASADDIRKWTEQRELAESSRERAAAQKFKDAAQLDDLADTKRSLAVDADSRAARSQAVIAAEEARVQELEARLATARKIGERVRDESLEQEGEHTKKSEAGDASGTKLADARADDLLAQNMSWSGQVTALEQRIAQAKQTIVAEQENAKEYVAIAANLREEAGRAAALADEQERDATVLLQEAHRLDEETDRGPQFEPETPAAPADTDVDVVPEPALGVPDFMDSVAAIDTAASALTFTDEPADDFALSEPVSNDIEPEPLAFDDDFTA